MKDSPHDKPNLLDTSDSNDNIAQPRNSMLFSSGGKSQSSSKQERNSSPEQSFKVTCPQKSEVLSTICDNIYEDVGTNININSSLIRAKSDEDLHDMINENENENKEKLRNKMLEIRNRYTPPEEKQPSIEQKSKSPDYKIRTYEPKYGDDKPVSKRNFYKSRALNDRDRDNKDTPDTKEIREIRVIRDNRDDRDDNRRPPYDEDDKRKVDMVAKAIMRFTEEKEKEREREKRREEEEERRDDGKYRKYEYYRTDDSPYKSQSKTRSNEKRKLY